MAYRLISATPSPYARKVRIALLEKGIPFDLLTEVPWDSTTTTPRHNPLKKLPILLVPKTTATSSNDPDDFAATVFESHHILAYLKLKHPSPTPLLSASDIDARLLALEVEVVADGVCDACVLLFFEKQRAAPSDVWTARQRRKVDGGITWLGKLVKERVISQSEEGKAFLIGGKFGLADVAVGTVCGYLECRWPGLEWRREWRGLARYVDWL